VINDYLKENMYGATNASDILQKDISY